MAASTLLTLGKPVLRAAQVANATRKEHKEIGRLVRAAVSRAVCPNPDDEGVDDVVKAIEPVLQTSPIPGEERKGLARAGAAVKRYFGIHRPLSGGVDLDPLPERLEQWVATAAASPRVEEALSRVTCAGRPDGSEAFARKFRDAFRHELYSNPCSPYRVRLVTQLAADQTARTHQQKEVRESAAALGLTSGAVGGGVFGVLDLATQTEPTTAVAIGGGAALVVASAGVTREVLRRRVTQVQQVLRDAVKLWVADLLSSLPTGRPPTTAPHPTVNELRQGVMRALEGKTSLEAPVRGPGPPPALLADLSQRLIPRSQAAEDDRMTAALYQLEDRLVRWSRASDERAEAACRDIYPALLEVIEAASVAEDQ